jgi:hypothetical protein
VFLGGLLAQTAVGPVYAQTSAASDQEAWQMVLLIRDTMPAMVRAFTVCGWPRKLYHRTVIAICGTEL